MPPSSSPSYVFCASTWALEPSYALPIVSQSTNSVGLAFYLCLVLYRLGGGTKGQGSTGSGRQFTWGHPLPEMSWRGLGRKEEASEVELQVQGIDKRVNFKC